MSVRSRRQGKTVEAAAVMINAAQIHDLQQTLANLKPGPMEWQDRRSRFTEYHAEILAETVQVIEGALRQEDLHLALHEAIMGIVCAQIGLAIGMHASDNFQFNSIEWVELARSRQCDATAKVAPLCLHNGEGVAENDHGTSPETKHGDTDIYRIVADAAVASVGRANGPGKSKRGARRGE